ncbi:uncharacterized protein LOC127242655 [Andrographis paniculata]|uniref:uncharacterized protein LOC127242655 n=1 Tax=Andrographis paniculata TaxID=175694 RepID=UPI0021E97BB4|nr:uncharacterized protein LOC127242655 [Andrographis paniculata]
MINTEQNCNGVGVGSGGDAAQAHEKQLSGATKKTALRDVQNENVGSVSKQQQENTLSGGGRSNGDTIKVCGTKRLTPERPSISKGFPSLAYNVANENVMNARRRFDLELGIGRLQNSVEKNSKFSETKTTAQLHHGITQKMNLVKDANMPNVPVATSNNSTAAKAFPHGSSNVSSPFGKPANSKPVAKVSPELPRSVDSKVTKDQLRTERYISLQNFLKQCDEAADRKEFIQMLLNSSPAELSRRAVELEKRAIQLTIEEGNEIQRMKAMNILAKSSPAKNLSLSTQVLQQSKQ